MTVSVQIEVSEGKGVLAEAVAELDAKAMDGKIAQKQVRGRCHCGADRPADHARHLALKLGASGLDQQCRARACVRRVEPLQPGVQLR